MLYTKAGKDGKYQSTQMSNSLSALWNADQYSQPEKSKNILMAIFLTINKINIHIYPAKRPIVFEWKRVQIC